MDKYLPVAGAAARIIGFEMRVLRAFADAAVALPEGWVVQVQAALDAIDTTVRGDDGVAATLKAVLDAWQPWLPFLEEMQREWHAATAAGDGGGDAVAGGSRPKRIPAAEAAAQLTAAKERARAAGKCWTDEATNMQLFAALRDVLADEGIGIKECVDGSFAPPPPHTAPAPRPLSGRLVSLSHRNLTYPSS